MPFTFTNTPKSTTPVTVPFTVSPTFSSANFSARPSRTASFSEKISLLSRFDASRIRTLIGFPIREFSFCKISSLSCAPTRG